MSASEVKEDLIQFVKELVETIITKALNELHESEPESESTALSLPSSKEPCKLTADHNKLKKENSVEETTSSTERNSTELEQPKADTSAESADVGEDSAKDFPGEDPQNEINVTTKFVSDLPAVTADGFETDKLKETTVESKERLRNSDITKLYVEQHGTCDPTQEKQKEGNKKPEEADGPEQFKDSDEDIEENVNRSIDTKGQSTEIETGSDKGIQIPGESVDASNIQQTESSIKHGPMKHTQSAEELFAQVPQEEPRKNSDLETQTIGEPAPESRVTKHLQQKPSVSIEDSASKTSIKTSEVITKQFQISIYQLVLIIMTSTIA